MTIIKETGYPIPQARSGLKTAYLRNELTHLPAFGESEVPVSIKITDLTQQAIAQVVHHFSKKTGKRFTVKNVGDGYRIWRIDKGESVFKKDPNINPLYDEIR